MEIVEPVRFFAGLALLLTGIVLLWHARGSHGFNHRKQAGVLALGGAIILVGLGLGLLDFGGGLPG